VLDVVLWCAQGLLAVVFGAAGLFKLLAPLEVVHQQLVWTATMSNLTLGLIGGSELLGAIFVVLPSVLRIWPMLTTLAAGGLFIIMLLAIEVQLGRHNVVGMAVCAALALVAGFVAWGRGVKLPVNGPSNPGATPPVVAH
jgi:hypothetical protein